MDEELNGAAPDPGEDADDGPYDEAVNHELLAELAAVMRPRLEPPPQVLDAARQSFTWRTVDAELATLTHDSLIDAGPVLARSSASPRILTFEVAAVQIEMEVEAATSGHRLLGQITPPAEVDVALRSREVGSGEVGSGEVGSGEVGSGEVRSGEAGDGEVGSAAARSDPLGRFVLPLPDGRPLVSVRCTFADGSAVETARVRL